MFDDPQNVFAVELRKTRIGACTWFPNPPSALNGAKVNTSGVSLDRSVPTSALQPVHEIGIS